MRADQAPRTPSWLSLRPEFWRKDLLRVVLRVTAVLGTCTWVPSTWLAIKLGMVSLFVLDTAVLASVITLGLAERIPTRLRAGCTSIVFYVLGAGLMIIVGSISQIFLFGFSLLSTLLLGLRWGLASVAVNVGTMLTIGFVGISSPEMVEPPWVMSLSNWSLVTANFAL